MNVVLVEDKKQSQEVVDRELAGSLIYEVRVCQYLHYLLLEAMAILLGLNLLLLFHLLVGLLYCFLLGAFCAEALRNFELHLMHFVLVNLEQC